ncbi:serine/threonine-protein kinase [Nonomuraea sp. NPDC049152]|uniref:serine/threonine-protein kinase n=1 Tax=Nonomuraea sp. NPDC049152 TaxID=3154350 RepID=UPI00340A7F1D
MSDGQQHAGRRVAGRYHLKEPIGRGGMGIVWRAHDELLDREVAVKEVRYAAVLGDEVQLLNRRTMREARAAARFTHPNVIVVHDVIEEDDRPWIVMQLVPSRSLGQVIKSEGPLQPRKVAEIGLAVLEALKGAHDAGVLHRDVKPENVLLAEDGRVVLTDFGIATLETETALTMTGLAGTPAFIAPERLKGLPARRESDLWSLGATLYTAVEGKAPHERGMAMATMMAVLNDDAAPATKAGPLKPVLDGLLAKEPVQRLTVDETARMLRRIIGQAQNETVRVERPPAVPDVDVDDTPTDPSLPVIVPPVAAKPPLRKPLKPKPGATKPDTGKSAASKPPVPEPEPEPEPEVAKPAAPAPTTAMPAAAEAPSELFETGMRLPETPTAASVGRPGVRRALPFVAVAIAILVVGGVAGLLGLRSAGNEAPQSSKEPTEKVTTTVTATATATTPAAQPSTTATPSTGPSPSPSDTAPALPEGWRMYKDKEMGFSVALPPDWETYQRKGSQVYFRGPGASSNSYLMIEESPDPGDDPYGDWKKQEPGARSGFGGYKLLDIKKVDYMKAAADWEFIWNTNTGETRVRNRGFVTDNGRGYALYWHTLNKNWKRDLRFFDTFAATFKPAK